MNRFSLHLLTYKLVALAVGGLSLFLGYRLFERGIPEQPQPSSLKVTHGQSGLELENAAPGIFFALFGAAIVGSVVFRGMTVRAEATEAAEPEDTRGSGPMVDPAAELGRLFIGSDLKRIVIYKLEEVLKRVGEVSIDDNDRYFLQKNIASVFQDLELASKGELLIEKQPSIRVPIEAPRQVASTKFEGLGSAPG
jgi:hypothetical protein